VALLQSDADALRDAFNSVAGEADRASNQVTPPCCADISTGLAGNRLSGNRICNAEHVAHCGMLGCHHNHLEHQRASGRTELPI
jgi:hypothetical protein